MRQPDLCLNLKVLKPKFVFITRNIHNKYQGLDDGYKKIKKYLN